MEIRKNNFNDPDRMEERGDERLEGFSASEMADRGPKDVLKDRSQYADTDAAAIRPVSNVNGDEDDDEDDETDDLIDNEDVDIDDDDDLDDEDLDEEDLDDIEFEEDEEDEEDDNL